MSQLLLINPIGKGKTIMAKRRTAAQKAATRKMLSANRARRGSKKSTTAVSVISKRSRRHNPIGLARVAKRRGVRRSNPISSVSMSGIKGMVREAAYGGAGALLVNTVSNYLPLPASLKSGVGRSAVRAAVAIGVGVLGSKLLSRSIATSMAVGALTVAAHEMLLAAATKAAPTLLLGDASTYYDEDGADGNVGAYASDMAGMGQWVRPEVEEFSS